MWVCVCIYIYIYWGYIGIMENKVETAIVYRVIQGYMGVMRFSGHFWP